MKIFNNSPSKHFTQTLPQHTSNFIKHTNFSQEIKNSFRNYVPKKWIQRSLFEIFLSNLNKSAHSIKICLTVITALHATQTGASSFLKIKECVNDPSIPHFPRHGANCSTIHSATFVLAGESFARPCQARLMFNLTQINFCIADTAAGDWPYQGSCQCWHNSFLLITCSNWLN